MHPYCNYRDFLAFNCGCKGRQMLFKEVRGINYYKEYKIHSSDGMDTHTHIYIYIQGVPGGMCQTSGECSFC